MQQDINQGHRLPPRYSLTARLGSGAYGTVFEGRDHQNGGIVAIKMIEWNPNPSAEIDQGLPLTVIREAALLKSIKHENVVELKDIVVRRDRTYLVMNLCSCNLRQHMDEVRGSGISTIDPAQLYSFMRQILSAVAFFHEKKVLHRDLKPDNILLDDTRKIVKIADFGMARYCLVKKNLTERCVTAWYRPPEIMLGDVNYGPAVDIWSTGCIMGELINLFPIFGCNSEFECLLLIFKHLGTPTEESWPGVTRLPYFQHTFPKWPARTPVSFIGNEVSQKGIGQDTIDLVCRMLQLDPLKRISACDALEKYSFLKTKPLEEQNYEQSVGSVPSHIRKCDSTLSAGQPAILDRRSGVEVKSTHQQHAGSRRRSRESEHMPTHKRNCPGL